MALRKNNLFRSHQANQVGDTYSGGTLEIRSGSQPADPDSAASGTLLATIDLPSPAFTSASNGVISMDNTWSGSTVATATAGWGRFKNAAGNMNMDVSVGESATDLIIDDDAIVSGGIVTVTSFTFTVPDGV